MDAIRDSSTDFYSYINVIEGFNLPKPPPFPSEGSLVYLPFRFKIGTCWEWGDEVESDQKHIDDLKLGVRFYSPNGKILADEKPEGHYMRASTSRATIVIDVSQFPFIGFGTYRIGISLGLEYTKDDNKYFKSPLRINDSSPSLADKEISDSSD